MSTVLVPYDESPMAERAFEQALDDHPDATIQLLYVLDFAAASYGAPIEGGAGRYFQTWETTRRDGAESRFEQARERAADHPIFTGRIETAVENGPPAKTIVKHAADIDADAIIIGSHGRTGLSRVLLGSVAESVVRRAHCPVVVVR
ncbi:universal stress protein [Halosegnis rubeus]|jgi:nucleotide-binding universal stress UspA family protein|uniref:Universal stress protein n=1 Tax=Halosegnis rubeus TaxID=2212850 RepID=A0A5N5U6B7_9EURY|nr:universal stress protein [Halosegnis rubeus]KAB7514103.1 universal stress protein [Halosegnis rubeus]